MASTEIYAIKDTRVSPVIQLVRGDTRTHIVRFMVRREYGGVDLSTLAWKINIKNAKGETDIALPHGAPEVNDTHVVVDWLISGIAADAPGETVYMLKGVDETAEGQLVVWQSGKGVILVGDALDAEPSPEQGQSISQLDKLIIYAQAELPAVIAAGEAAAEAAKRANEAADRAENAGGSAGGLTVDAEGNAAIGGSFTVDEEGNAMV